MTLWRIPVKKRAIVSRVMSTYFSSLSSLSVSSSSESNSGVSSLTVTVEYSTEITLQCEVIRKFSLELARSFLQSEKHLNLIFSDPRNLTHPREMIQIHGHSRIHLFDCLLYRLVHKLLPLDVS